MFISPMLLEKRETPFDDERYIFEPKIDGHRQILSRQAGGVRLYTRHGNEVTNKYPELLDVPLTADSDIVLDGEVACLDQESGLIDFDLMQERSVMQNQATIRQAMARQPVHFFAFDILRYRGQDVRSWPLIERKALLDNVLQNNRHYSKVMSVDGSGVDLFKVIKDKGLEGIVAKRKNSRYVSRRDSDWLKIINYQYATVQIAGYRKSGFGWLTQYEGRGVGIIELAVPAMHRRAFYRIAEQLRTGEDRDHVYLHPVIQVNVRFRNWTRNAMMRSPEFINFQTS